MTTWSHWRKFPDPRERAELMAPFGPAVYELRRADNQVLILVGSAGHCASRMSSLLPAPFGCGTRDNNAKREYVLANLAIVEYRVAPFTAVAEARKVETELRRKNQYTFPQ